MLGHASAAMPLNVYRRLFDGDLSALPDRLHDAYQPSIGANFVQLWANHPFAIL
jgi:hypothetical protein